jgi:nucleoside-diphosphate-sugar epimerase
VDLHRHRRRNSSSRRDTVTNGRRVSSPRESERSRHADFVAGASGAIGSRLVPQLVARGHEVVGTTRSTEKTKRLYELGAEPVVVNVLDRLAVREAVLAARPDTVVHEATALSEPIDFRDFDRSFAQTNRLRTAGTDALLAACGRPEPASSRRAT